MAMLFVLRGRAKSPCGCTQMLPNAEKDRSILVSDFLCRAVGKAGANVAPARPADVAGAPRSWGKIQGVCCPQRLERSPAGRAVSWQAFFWGDIRGRRGQHGHGTACRCRPHGANRERERERGREGQRERREREREREERALAQRVTTLKHFQPPLRFWISLLTCDGGREGMARS